MKKRRGLLLSSLLVFSIQVLGVFSAQALPRPPMWPPMPELTPVLHRETFDEVYYAGVSNAVVTFPNYGTLRASWSGYSLERVGTVTPWVISGLGETGQVQVATDQGALRFWFQPYWSSGTGPGAAVTLAELAAVNGLQTAVLWVLRVSADGTGLQLAGPGGEVLLAAEIDWTAGSWHQVILNYGTNGTELIVDGAVATKGEATLSVPASVTRLVIGSTLSGELSASGEFEEVYCFARPLKVAFHYTSFAGIAALGPISEDEQAYRQELMEKWKALKAEQAKESGGGGMEMLRLSGPSANCVTNGPVYLTNVVANFTTNDGWTVYFDIAGGTNGVVYDIFSTTEFVGNDITNSVWTWLETGMTCETHWFTNQPTNQVFYILTVPGADRDADGLYDGWEWKHFGTLEQPPDGENGDYDNDGISNLLEYQNGTDPNTIAFEVGPTNKYVRTSATTVQLRVDNGVPFYKSVLVDSTNFPTASWSAFSSTSLNVNLGSVEGWHDVWIGLRGLSPNSEPVWQWMRLKLDFTPPLIVTTAPVANVSQPMIQLKGYSPESLSSISCQVSNSVGVFSNQLIVVFEAFYDTNTYEYTTNWFQGYDIDLSAGANQIRIQATDQAGNPTATNFTFTLASDTVAPVVELWWPQSGAELIGETFTWRGLVDDFTASLTATLVDAGSNITERAATVERNGKFWFEDLPLAAGVSTLTLKAEDYWGNIITTNISVTKSSVELTIDPVDENVLNDPTITVTGSISVNDHTVWVNGIKATPNGDGTWQAVGVPVPPGGTAVIQARAIPNSDSGGNGSGGGGAGPAGTGNPGSAQQKDKGKEEDKPHRLYLYKDDVEKQLNDRTERTETPPNWATAQYIDKYEHHFTYDPQTSPPTFLGTGKKHHEEHYRSSSGPPSDIGPCESTFAWNAASPAGCAYEHPCTGTPGWIPAPPVNAAHSEHCEVKDPPPTVFEWWDTLPEPLHFRWDYKPYERKAQTKWRLFTGGKDKPKRDALWSIGGQASELVNKRAVRPFTGEATRGIPSSQIKVFEKTLASDGIIFKTLANGTHVDVPFEVTGPGRDFYTFSLNPTRYDLKRNYACPIGDMDMRDVGVGEIVNYSFSPALPQGAPAAWGVGGGTLSDSTANSTKYTATDTQTPAAHVKATVRDETIYDVFDVLEPTGIKIQDPLADSYIPPYVGAGMRVTVMLLPTTVSFYRLQVKEPPANATQLEGYFASFGAPPHDSAHRADQWYNVQCNNTVFTDHADSFGWPLGVSGKYTWPISPIWRVGSTGATRPLSGWTDQLHILTTDGKMTVKKFGLTVTRGVNQSQGVFE